MLIFSRFFAIKKHQRFPYPKPPKPWDPPDPLHPPAAAGELGVQAPVGFWDPLGLSSDGDVGMPEGEETAWSSFYV